jgi:protein-tyrosine phosphatase
MSTAKHSNFLTKFAFHCGGGSGRTGTVAVGTLLSLGKAKTIGEAEEMAKAARPKINVKPQMKEALHRLFPNY